MSRTIARVDFREERIDSLFQQFDQDRLPGVAAGISINGQVVYRRGFGLASMQLPIELSPRIRMRIGSVSKHFTCLAYALLCEEGRADMDDPVGKYLPELHPVTHSITLRQLMGHTGGLRDTFDLCWTLSGWDHSASSADLLSLYRTLDDVNDPPGVAWNYNNGGYLMLSVVIERITGKSLEEVFKERIFDPIGMEATLLCRHETDFVENSATPHMLKPAGGYQRRQLGGAIAGEGGILSNVDDMLRWLAHMDTPTVGNAATWRTMRTPHRLPNGTSTGYGLGLMADRYRGVKTLHHPGSVGGWSSQLLKASDAGMDIVILANREGIDPSLLATKILDECLVDLDPIETTLGKSVSGIFRSVTTDRVIELSERNGQQMVAINGADIPFSFHPDGTLRPVSTFSYLKWVISFRGDPGHPRVLYFDDFGNGDELVRQAPARELNCEGIAGRYRSGNTETDAKISATPEGYCLTTTGRFGSSIYALNQRSDTIWRATLSDHSAGAFGGVLIFDACECCFRLSTLRTRALRFRRDP